MLLHFTEEFIHSINIYCFSLIVFQALEEKNKNKNKTVNKTDKNPDEDAKSQKVNTVLEIT